MIPGLNGIIQAYSLFHQMQGQKRADEHLAMQKAELEMQKQRDADMKAARDQQQQAQDLEIRAKLLDMGTPLVGGMLEKQGTIDAGTMPGMNAPMPFTYATKPDPSKVLKYKDLAIVPHSKQDRQRMAMEQLQAEQQVKLAYETQLAAVKRQMESIPAPSWAQEFGFQPGTMLPTSAVTALAGTRQQGLHEQFTAKENAADRASREKIAVAGQEAANARNERTNATRMAATAMAAALRKEEKAKAEVAPLQKEHDALQLKEQAAWDALSAAKNELNQLDQQLAKMKPKDANYGSMQARRAKVVGEVARHEAAAQAYLEQKRQVLERKDRILGQNEAGKIPVKPKAAPSTPGKLTAEDVLKKYSGLQ